MGRSELAESKLLRTRDKRKPESWQLKSNMIVADQDLQSILEFAAVGIYFTDLKGRCTYANRACLEFLGLKTSDDIMNKVVHDMAHHTRPDGSHYPIEECKIYCAFQNLERSHVDDEVFWRADGSSFPVEYWSHPIFESGKAVGAVVSFMDISKRVEIQNTKELMLGELDHRVKNLLATVKAIATQTMRGETDPEKFMKVFTSRVDALAKAHGLLTQTAWNGASLIKVLKTQLAVGTPSRDGVIRMQGPDVMLSAQMTMNLGMMLHELGTNAVKYGALSNPSGYVTLDWDVIEKDGGRRLQMTWKEHGGPPVSEPERKGFGTILIERSLQRTHGSSVEQSFEKDGLRCVLDVHLSEVG